MPPKSATALHFSRVPAGPPLGLPLFLVPQARLICSSLSKLLPPKGIGSPQIAHPTLGFLCFLPRRKGACGSRRPFGIGNDWLLIYISSFDVGFDFSRCSYIELVMSRVIILYWGVLAKIWSWKGTDMFSLSFFGFESRYSLIVAENLFFFLIGGSN